MANWSLPDDRNRFWLVTFVTVIRIPAGIALIILLATTSSVSWTVAGISFALLALIEITDGLDGYLARRLNVTSEWGAMLDPYSDSITRLLVYFGLARAEPELVWIWVPLVMAFRDVTVAYCRIMISRTGGTVAAKQSGKIKAVVQGFMAFSAILSPLVFPDAQHITVPAISLFVIVVTLWSIGQYAESAFASTKSPEE